MSTQHTTRQTRPDRTLLVFDAAVLLILTGATAWLRHSCTPWSDVSGDAYMALECAWKMWNGEWAAVPSQPIYGYGLCVSMAGLFAGTEELWQVAVPFPEERLQDSALRYQPPELVEDEARFLVDRLEPADWQEELIAQIVAWVLSGDGRKEAGKKIE